MKLEKRLQVGLRALIKATDVKRENADQNQEDNDEDVSNRGRKISLQFASENCE